MTRHFTPATATFVGAAGNKLVADVFGEGGDPVLLLHGGGQTRHAWSKTAAAIAGKGHVAYALDQRGHGDSDWVATGETIAELAERLGIDPEHLSETVAEFNARHAGDALHSYRSPSPLSAERMREAGCEVALEIWPRMPHVWHGFAPVLPEARRAIARIGEFVQHRAAGRSALDAAGDK